MISYLRGNVILAENQSAILDVQGVGYEVICSSNTLSDLVVSADTALWIYTHVREDSLLLFGFSSQVEKKLFESLIKVNGIGPKMAITILSGASLDQIIDFIEKDNVKGLTGLPKVGKKTAEQMILTLKGKLVFEQSSVPRPDRDVLSALVNLGFRATDVKEVLKETDDKMSFEDQLRKALQSLGGGA